MSQTRQSKDAISRATVVASGEGLLDEHYSLGINNVAFKVVPQDSNGLLVVESTLYAKGGPARHLHNEQEEWFYVAEGEFIFEVGDERLRLKTGDSLLAPRKVPHAWAHIGDAIGKLVIAFTPAGLMVPFFRDVGKTNTTAPEDPAFWKAYNLELVGPPLRLE